ncbi:MAG: hypothetical protein ABIF77_08795 [bacterium]
MYCGAKYYVIWFCLISLTTGPAVAGVPDLDNSYAECATSDPVMLLVVPDGSGDRLDNCQTLGGPRVDATITLTLLDAVGDPVVNYPASDIWLVCPCPTWGYVPGGTIPDFDTDSNGQTQWSSALPAGGTNESEFLIVSSAGTVPIPNAQIFSTSPDLNASSKVDLTDVVLFATAYYAAGKEYNASVDFYFDGVLNLSDIVVLAQKYGANSPEADAFAFYYGPD